MTRHEKIIDKIVELTRTKYPDSEIYLYGSQARGDGNYLSDWDLLILMDSDTVSFEEETKIINEFYELELETGEVISPLVYSKTEWIKNHSVTPLYENIKKEGIRIK